MSDKLIRDTDDGAYFVGYLDTPTADRRYLLALTGAGLLTAGGLAAGLAALQGGAGRGEWDMATIVTRTGRLVPEPYPMLQTVDEAGRAQTILLACDSKCGAQNKLSESDIATDQVEVEGSLIQRGRHQMMAVVNRPDWIRPAGPEARLPDLRQFAAQSEGAVSLRGEILDSKCWFGAMRPNEGPVHKACAILCIAGGLAPYFYSRDILGRSRAVMITDPSGQALVQPILRHVADPVAVDGELVRLGDLLQIRMDPARLQVLGY